jgi:D-alanyl-D-alanine carboxypeptidase
MKKLTGLISAILLIAALSPAALSETLDYGAFAVSFSESGVTVLKKGDPSSVSLDRDSFLRMVSKAYPISFEQADDISGLAKISKKSYQDSKYGTQYIHPEALAALEELVAAAKSAGFKRTRLVETYRSSAIQQKRFGESVSKRVKEGMTEQAAYEAAHLVTALPGESEHHLGVTLDILQRGDSMGPSFAKTKFAKWLAQNSAKFGFIVRYPDGMEDITGITYEPWHLRFVGKPMAVAIGGDCMENFFAKLKASRVLRLQNAETGEETAFIYIPNDGAASVSSSLAPYARFSETGEGGSVLVVSISTQLE